MHCPGKMIWSMPLIPEGLVDDRRSGTLSTPLGSAWRLVSDGVMGGLSQGMLCPEFYRERAALTLRGEVTTANNGGFLQMALALVPVYDASRFRGVRLTVAGNGERYNLHLRTLDLERPWQSYRATFTTTADWQTVELAFAALNAHRTAEPFRPERLTSLGLVAIGRDFRAELRLAYAVFYR